MNMFVTPIFLIQIKYCFQLKSQGWEARGDEQKMFIQPFGVTQ